jgi:hypothetical protein
MNELTAASPFLAAVLACLLPELVYLAWVWKGATPQLSIIRRLPNCLGDCEDDES